MAKLIGSIATIVFATVTVAGAAPRQGAVGKAGSTAQAKTAKSAKPANRKARKAVTAKNRKAPTAQKAVAKVQRQAVKEEVKKDEVKIAKHDRYAEEQELKSLKANVKTAQKAGDWQRVSRDRREMYRLEAHVRADKADDQDQTRQARAAVKKRSSRIPFWGWWRRS